MLGVTVSTGVGGVTVSTGVGGVTVSTGVGGVTVSTGVVFVTADGQELQKAPHCGLSQSPTQTTCTTNLFYV